MSVMERIDDFRIQPVHAVRLIHGYVSHMAVRFIGDGIAHVFLLLFRDGPNRPGVNSRGSLARGPNDNGVNVQFLQARP